MPDPSPSASTADRTAPDPAGRLVAVTLDPHSIRRAPPEVEHERAVAIFDLVEENTFAVPGHSGPFRLLLSMQDGRLVFDVRSEANATVAMHILSLTPLQRVVRDYEAIRDSYHRAIRSDSPSRIQAIDMGRRGLHNEGSAVLMERLKDKVAVDLGTARRLFTLICALRWRGGRE